MFKIDQVKGLLDCEQCLQLLVNPITIPCGYSVCKKHLDEQLENSMEENKFQCVLCQRQHVVPTEGFVINRRLQDALEIELNKFKPSQAYEDCKKIINDAKDYVAKIEALNKDPETYIYDYFEEIKRLVDLRREEIKLRVDSCSDEMIRSIENSKENCVRLAKEGRRLKMDINKQKKVLDELLERFDRFDKNFDSNTLNNGFTSFGYAYQHPNYQQETNKAQSILAGSYTFHIEEIEIYAKTDK